MAGQMSALPAEPDHLIRWARADASSSGGTAGEVTNTTFLSRPDYGRYLRDTLAEAEHQALPVARLTRITSSVLAVRPGNGDRPVRLVLRDGEIGADVAVLATGNAPSTLPFDAPASERIVAEPWRPGALDRVAGRPATGDGALGPDGDQDRSVVIVGTGLTMLDLAMAITDSDPAAVIHAVSRHGLLPRAHPGRPASGRQPR
jgi:uncharacterized NAD(P)/FAD-binding protein YdhS